MRVVEHFDQPTVEWNGTRHAGHPPPIGLANSGESGGFEPSPHSLLTGGGPKLTRTFGNLGKDRLPEVLSLLELLSQHTLQRVLNEICRYVTLHSGWGGGGGKGGGGGTLKSRSFPNTHREGARNPAAKAAEE